MTKGVIKDLERRSLSWVIWVGPKCSHMYPSKREAGEVLRETRRGWWDQRQRWQ